MSRTFFDQAKQMKIISFSFTIIILLAASLAIFFSSQTLITKELAPELEKKSFVVGQTTLSPIQRALAQGIKLNELRGVSEHFQAVLKDNKEFRYVILSDDKGNIVFSAGVKPPAIEAYIKKNTQSLVKSSESFDKYYNTKIPIQLDTGIAGYLNLGIDINVIAQSTMEILYDAIVVFIISLLVTFEILIFIMSYRVSRPVEIVKSTLKDAANGFIHYLPFSKSRDEIGQFAYHYSRFVKKIQKMYQETVNKFVVFEVMTEDKEKVTMVKKEIEGFETQYNIAQKKKIESNVTFIRTPLFLFVFGESLSISFLPLFSSYLYEPLWLFPRQFVVAMPIVFFMLVYTIAQPLSGLWSNISSKREIFLVGAFISTMGLFGAAFANDIFSFLGWRMLTALGYGMVLISCQAYIIDNTPLNKRTQGLAVYISGFYSATVCGAAIGAILADNVGYNITFMISAVLVILSALFVVFYIKDAEVEEAPKKFSFSAFKSIFKNSSFLSMLLCVSIPSKMMLASVIYYIAPTYLSSIGTRQSEIGRIIMIYGFTMLALSPIVARYVDKLQKPKLFIAAGAVLASISFIPVLYHSDLWGFVVTVFLLAIGHSINATAQVAIIPLLLRNESKELGDTAISSIYRFLEMQGFVIGPTVAGFLIGVYGFIPSLTIISVVSASLTFIYLIVLWVSSARSKKLKDPSHTEDTMTIEPSPSKDEGAPSLS